MFRSMTVSLGFALTMLVAAACMPALPGTRTAPNVNTVPAQTPTPLPIVSTIPALTETPEPTPTQQSPASTVLPAPLYYLAPSGTRQQIWRIETDGTTHTQI